MRRGGEFSEASLAGIPQILDQPRDGIEFGGVGGLLDQRQPGLVGALADPRLGAEAADHREEGTVQPWQPGPLPGPGHGLRRGRATGSALPTGSRGPSPP